MKDRILREVRRGNDRYFYNSWTWRKKRESILRRDNYECQMCKTQGLVSTGKDMGTLTVHHIKELLDHPELMLDDNNLVTVCFSCHNEIHERFEHKETKAEKLGMPERWE